MPAPCQRLRRVEESTHTVPMYVDSSSSYLLEKIRSNRSARSHHGVTRCRFRYHPACIELRLRYPRGPTVRKLSCGSGADWFHDDGTLGLLVATSAVVFSFVVTKWPGSLQATTRAMQRHARGVRRARDGSTSASQHLVRYLDDWHPVRYLDDGVGHGVPGLRRERAKQDVKLDSGRRDLAPARPDGR